MSEWITALVIISGLGAIFLVAAIVAFRGRRYWATWLMLIGTVLQFVGAVAFSMGWYYWLQAMISSTGSNQPSWAGNLMKVGLLVPLGFLLFGAGMIGICSRLGGLEKRAAELEVFNRQLQDRIQG